jgi:hypothetical protein
MGSPAKLADFCTWQVPIIFRPGIHGQGSVAGAGTERSLS